MVQFIQHLASSLLAIILTLVALFALPLVFFVVILPILLLRKIVSRLGLIIHPEFSKILSHRSTNFSLEEFHGHTENAIVGDLVLEGNWPIEQCKAKFQQNLINRKLSNGELKYPELQQFAVTWMNFKFWKTEENFDINDHVRLYNESRPNGLKGVVSHTEFHALRQSFMNSPFPKNKSPWEVSLVHDYLPDDPTLSSKAGKDIPISVVLVRYHHSLGDGFSGKKLILDIFDKKETAKKSKCSNSNLQKTDSINFLSVLKSLWNFTTLPIRCIYEFIHLSIQLTERGPWDVLEDQRAPAVHAFTNLIPVSRVKRIKDEFKMTFSSVVFHICNEAMIKMMATKGMKTSESVIAIFPLPLPNHPDKLRNHMTHGAYPLPTKLDLSPYNRLQLVHQQYEQVKSSTIPISASFLTLIVGGLPTCLIRAMARGLIPPVVISSVPGFQHVDWEVDGCKLICNYVNTGLLNLSGLAFSIYSYCDHMKFCVTSSSKILNDQDIQEFASSIERELQILEDEIVPNKISIS